MTATPASAVTRTAPVGPTETFRQSRTGTIIAWVLQVLLGFAIASGGVLKLTADPVMVEMFDDIGAGQWLRVVVGLLEIAGGVGLLIPRVRAVAALCLLVLLLGATVTNVTVLDVSPLSALGFAAVAMAIVLLGQHELPGRSNSEPRPT